MTDVIEEAIEWARSLPKQYDPKDFCGNIFVHYQHDDCAGFPRVVFLARELEN